MILNMPKAKMVSTPTQGPQNLQLYDRNRIPRRGHLGLVNRKIFTHLFFSQMLTLFYERCSRYYGAAGGQGAYGCASDEEKKLTMTLFSSIFDSLSR